MINKLCKYYFTSWHKYELQIDVLPQQVFYAINPHQTKADSYSNNLLLLADMRIMFPNTLSFLQVG